MLLSRHLENFLALCEARTMHAAAERRGITQPALTRSLKVLEEDLGTTLFTRSASGIAPTEAGKTLYRYARDIDQQARIAALDVGRSSIETEGRLRIGVGPVLAVTSFPSVLVAFHKAFPAVQVTVETGVTAHLLEGLVEGSLDVIATSRPAHPLPEHFARIHLFSKRMAVICRDGHPLRRQKDVTIEELAAYGRVGFLEDHHFETLVRRLFGSKTEKMRLAVLTPSTSIMLDLLASTDYFSVVNELILPVAARRGVSQLAIADYSWDDLQLDIMCRNTFVDSLPIRTIRSAWKGT